LQICDIQPATVIACTSLSILQHPANAIAPPLLKHQKSTIYIFPKSDIVPAQVLPLSNASGDQSIPEPMADGEHNRPHHQKATYEGAEQCIEAMVFAKPPWPMISDERYSMVDEAWQLHIAAQYPQWAIACSPAGMPSVPQLPGGPAVKINQQT
jgi:hypothetical protein